VETLTYGSGRASGCDSPGLLNYGVTLSSVALVSTWFSCEGRTRLKHARYFRSL